MISRLQYLLFTTTLIQLHQSQTFRYVIDNDNDFAQYFAFAIDECILVSAQTGKYVKYSCSDIGVEKRVYDDECETLKEGETIEYWTEDDKSPCGGDKFSCSGDDRWTELGFYTGSCSLTPVLVLPLVMGCYCDGSDSSYHVSCSGAPLSGTYLPYSNTTCQEGKELNSTDLSECTFKIQISSVKIYSQIYGCRLSDPTNEPTMDPTLAPTVFNPLELRGLDDIYKAVALAFICAFVLIGGVSWIDAWYFRPNDYFKIGALGAMTIQTIDMISDCFFSAEVIHQYGSDEQPANKKPQLLAIFLLSIFFIALPSILALFQLYSQAKKHWLQSDYVRAWLSKYFTLLLFISIASGSSFSAVSLLNSYIFHLEIFDMGLTDKQLKRFNSRRVWSVVVCENCPQLILQSYFLILQGGSIFDHLITLSSMIMSLVSIVISVMAMTMERTINKTQRSVIISMDVTGEWVEDEASRCRTMNFKLRKKLAPILGVDWNVIEVVKPMYINGGLSLDIIVYVNDGFENWDTTLDEANAAGRLPKIFVDAWNLKVAGNLLVDPKEIKGILISNIQWRLTESKEDVKIRAASGADPNNAVFKSTASVSSRGRVPSLRASDIATASASAIDSSKITPIAENAAVEIEMAESSKKTKIVYIDDDEADVEKSEPAPAYNADAVPVIVRRRTKRRKTEDGDAAK